MEIKRIEYSKEKGFRLFGPIGGQGSWPLRTLSDEEIRDCLFLCKSDNPFSSYIRFYNEKPYVINGILITYVEDLKELYLIECGETNES